MAAAAHLKLGSAMRMRGPGQPAGAGGSTRRHTGWCSPRCPSRRRRHQGPDSLLCSTRARSPKPSLPPPASCSTYSSDTPAAPGPAPLNPHCRRPPPALQTPPTLLQPPPSWPGPRLYISTLRALACSAAPVAPLSPLPTPTSCSTHPWHSRRAGRQSFRCMARDTWCPLSHASTLIL